VAKLVHDTTVATSTILERRGRAPPVGEYHQPRQCPFYRCTGRARTA
jgi:hypothetical protein